MFGFSEDENQGLVHAWQGPYHQASPTALHYSVGHFNMDMRVCIQDESMLTLARLQWAVYTGCHWLLCPCLPHPTFTAPVYINTGPGALLYK